MEGKYSFEQFNEDLDNGYKIIFDYVRNRYMLYKVSDNCYMQEVNRIYFYKCQKSY